MTAKAIKLIAQLDIFYDKYIKPFFPKGLIYGVGPDWVDAKVLDSDFILDKARQEQMEIYQGTDNKFYIGALPCVEDKRRFKAFEAMLVQLNKDVKISLDHTESTPLYLPRDKAIKALSVFKLTGELPKNPKAEPGTYRLL